MPDAIAECEVRSAERGNLLPSSGWRKLAENSVRLLEAERTKITQLTAILTAPLYQDPELAIPAIHRFLRLAAPVPTCHSCGCPRLPDDDPNHCAGCGAQIGGAHGDH